MAKKKKLTENQKAYNKELKRIRSFIKRATKRGFLFPTDIIPEKPARITKQAIQKVKKITSKALYEVGQYFDKATQELISGTEGRKLERSRAAYKGIAQKQIEATPEPEIPDFSDIVLQNVLEEIGKWVPLTYWTEWFSAQKENDKNILDRMIQGAIRSEGRSAVALRLEANAEEVNALLQEILYGSGGGDYNSGSNGRNQINFDLVRFSTILKGEALTPQESIDLTSLSEEINY